VVVWVRACHGRSRFEITFYEGDGNRVDMGKNVRRMKGADVSRCGATKHDVRIRLQVIKSRNCR
jgi:hypothetical protein